MESSITNTSNSDLSQPHTNGHSQGEETALVTEAEAFGRITPESPRAVPVSAVPGKHRLRPSPAQPQYQSLKEALSAELAELATRAGLATQFYVQGVELQ